jgi:hypothetical protein
LINVEEHIYNDDPKRGHPDCRTFLKGVSYFFLGNGLIQAAIQVAPEGEGTILGLLIMNPEKLHKKRESLTFDPESGIKNTEISLRVKGVKEAIGPSRINARWQEKSGVPAVRVQWSWGDLSINELFYCPDGNKSQLIREINLNNLAKKTIETVLRTGVKNKIIEIKVYLLALEEKRTIINYTLIPSKNSVDLAFIPEAHPHEDIRHYWEESAQLEFQSPLLNHFFFGSKVMLSAVIANSGRVDASIWQYNREWVRDQSFLAIGLVLSGFFKQAETILHRLLSEFVSQDGDTIDSSEIRDPEEVELDQNGTLLYALKQYALWTGKYDLISNNWGKIVKTAEYPLKDIFQHRQSGMLFNRREYWERHKAHGVEQGIELGYQFFVSLGLESAAWLARKLAFNKEARRWQNHATRIREAMLNHPEFALNDKERGLIKRRSLTGDIQETIVAEKDSGLPKGAPLASSKFNHYLNPDTSTAFPIAMGFIPADSDIVKKTLTTLEVLWSQNWKRGGYGRYNYTSEPDAHGGWPFPSLIVARAYAEAGDLDKVWRVLRWLDSIPGSLSCSWFEMYGPRIAPPYPQNGIIPWNWAELITLLIHHILGIQPHDNHLRFRPRLLPEMGNVSGSLPFRNHRITLEIHQEAKRKKPVCFCNGKPIPFGSGDILIPFDEDNINIKAMVP